MPAGIHAFASQGEASAAKGGGSLAFLMSSPPRNWVLALNGGKWHVRYWQILLQK